MKLTAAFAGLITVLGVVATRPAYADELPAAVPPSIFASTCATRDTASYTIPAVAGLEYDVIIDNGFPREDVIPGTYMVAATSVVEFTAHTEGLYYERTLLDTWVITFEQPVDCPTTPRASARIVGRCKSNTVRLHVRDIEWWQSAPQTVFEVTINDRNYWWSTLSTGDIEPIYSQFNRNGHRKAVRVYVNDVLIAERTFFCGARR